MSRELAAQDGDLVDLTTVVEAIIYVWGKTPVNCGGWGGVGKIALETVNMWVNRKYHIVYFKF